MKLLIDNSVVFKLFIEEDKSDKARELFSQDHDFYFLDFTFLEAANSFASAVKRQRIGQRQAVENLENFKKLATQIIATFPYYSSALELALQLNHSVYDCLYAIAAKSKNATLVTCDEKFANKLVPLNIQTKIL